MNGYEEWSPHAKETFHYFDSHPEFQTKILMFYSNGCKFGRKNLKEVNGREFKKYLTGESHAVEFTPVRDRMTALLRGKQKQEGFDGWPSNLNDLIALYPDSPHLVFYLALQHGFDAINNYAEYKESTIQHKYGRARFPIWARELKSRFSKGVPCSFEYLDSVGFLKGCKAYFQKKGTKKWLKFCKKFDIKLQKKKSLQGKVNNSKIREQIEKIYLEEVLDKNIFINSYQIMNDRSFSVFIEETEHTYSGAALKSLINKQYGTLSKAGNKCGGVKNLFLKLKKENKIPDDVNDPGVLIYKGNKYDSHMEIIYASTMDKLINVNNLLLTYQPHPKFQQSDGRKVTGDFLFNKKVVIELSRYENGHTKSSYDISYVHYMTYYLKRLAYYNKLNIPYITVYPSELCNKDFWVSHINKIQRLCRINEQFYPLSIHIDQNRRYPTYWNKSEHVINELESIIQERLQQNPSNIHFPSLTEIHLSGLAKVLKPSFGENKTSLMTITGLHSNVSSQEITRFFHGNEKKGEGKQAFAVKFGVFAVHKNKREALRGATPFEALPILLKQSQKGVNFKNITKSEFKRLVGAPTYKTLMDHFKTLKKIKSWILSHTP